MTAAIDGRGQRIDYVRDVLGRTLSKTPLGLAGEAVTYAYDGGTNGVGQLTQVTDASGTTAFTYDHRSNRLSKSQGIGSATASLAYTYDLADRIVSITYPSGRVVAYVRDGKGRVSAVQTKANAAAGSWSTLASGMTYEAFGSLKSASFGNGNALSADYGNDGRLASRRLYAVASGTSLSLLSYGYDNDDNITSVTDGVSASASTSFAYDALGRLTRASTAQASATPGSYQRQDYAYDANGNRTAVEWRMAAGDVSAAKAESYARTAGTNRLASIATSGAATGTRTFTQDARGNQSSDIRNIGGALTSVSASYDGHGRLISYATGASPALTFAYNGLGDRVMQGEAGGGASAIRRYVYDSQGRMIGEYGTGGADVKGEYIYLHPDAANDNDSPHASDDGQGGYGLLAVMAPDAAAGNALTAQYVHTNHVAAPIFMTNESGERGCVRMQF